MQRFNFFLGMTTRHWRAMQVYSSSHLKNGCFYEPYCVCLPRRTYLKNFKTDWKWKPYSSMVATWQNGSWSSKFIKFKVSVIFFLCFDIKCPKFDFESSRSDRVHIVEEWWRRRPCIPRVGCSSPTAGDFSLQQRYCCPSISLKQCFGL